MTFSVLFHVSREEFRDFTPECLKFFLEISLLLHHLILHLGLRLCHMLYLYLAIMAANQIPRILHKVLQINHLHLRGSIVRVLACGLLESGAVLIGVLDMMTGDLAERPYLRLLRCRLLLKLPIGLV